MCKQGCGRGWVPPIFSTRYERATHASDSAPHGQKKLGDIFWARSVANHLIGDSHRNIQAARNPVTAWNRGGHKPCDHMEQGGSLARVTPRGRSTVAPPQHSFNEIAGFETSSRPYLLKYGDPLPSRRSSFDSPLQTRKYTKVAFSYHSSSCRAVVKPS